MTRIMYQIQVVRCRRGFIAKEVRLENGMTETWAFERIEDLAEWMVEQFNKDTSE